MSDRAIHDPYAIIAWYDRPENLAALTRHMAEHGCTARDVADAVEKPWKYVDEMIDYLTDYLDERGPEDCPSEVALLRRLSDPDAGVDNYPRTEAEARTCVHGNRYWFGHECGLCETAKW